MAEDADEPQVPRRRWRRFGRESRDRGEGPAWRWRREPVPGLFFGLAIVLLGVTLFLATQGWIPWADWWKYFMVGLGGILIIQVGVGLLYPGYRRLASGRLIVGIALISLGVGFLGGFGNWWPLIVVAVGLAVLLGSLLRGR